MSQTMIAILVGLLAGVGGALAVQYVGGGREPAEPRLSGELTSDSDLEARLDRIEALLERKTLSAAPSLRGAGEGAVAKGGGLDLDALAARLEERLKPAVQESVRSSVEEVLEAEERGGAKRVRRKRQGKKKTTLAVAAAELELTRDEEDAVRRIAAETTEAFFKLLAGKDETVEDVRRAFEDARHDSQKKIAVSTKYLGKAMGNLGGLIQLGLTHDSKMKAALGPDKAKRLEKEYKLTDLDPYGLEDMFDFD